MKTIEIISRDRVVRFTTKSVTFNEKEFLYKNMSDVTKNEAEHYYTFTYDGEVKALPYDPKDAKVVDTIFGQVQSMHKKRAAAAAAGSTERPAEPPVERPVETEEKRPEETASGIGETASAIYETPINSNEMPASSNEAPVGDHETPIQEAEEKATPETDINGDVGGTAAEITETPTEETPTETSKDAAPKDPEKRERVKKSLSIFGIILAVLLILAIVYFLIFGTEEKVSPVNPPTESQTYEDIDELIDDLQ